MFPKPVIRATIGKFASDGFCRSSVCLGQVHDITEARGLALEALPVESKYLDSGDYVAFRTFVDYGDQYAWLGEPNQYRYDHAWERLTP